jgi:hypothetical protein
MALNSSKFIQEFQKILSESPRYNLKHVMAENCDFSDTAVKYKNCYFSLGCFTAKMFIMRDIPENAKAATALFLCAVSGVWSVLLCKLLSFDHCQNCQGCVDCRYCQTARRDSLPVSGLGRSSIICLIRNYQKRI